MLGTLRGSYLAPMLGTATILALSLASAGAGAGFTAFAISLRLLRKQTSMTRLVADLWEGYKQLPDLVSTQAKLIRSAQWMEETTERLGARTESLAKDLRAWQEETRAIGQETAAGAARSAEALAMVQSLEKQAVERLITREEVSEAFAELARIEEQRLRQAAAARQAEPAVRPVSSLGIGAGDPWGTSAAGAPTDAQTLLREITEMNARLRERLQQAEG